MQRHAQDYGGWQSRSIVEDFADYAEAVFSALGDRVPFWITINEPWVTATLVSQSQTPTLPFMVAVMEVDRASMTEVL